MQLASNRERPDLIDARLREALGASFTIQRELTGGGMSRLFVADDASLGRRVVVKVLPHDLAGGVSLERFRREIQTLARLQHPNIVPVLTAGEVDGLPYFTMPFVEGESLRAAIIRDGRPSIDRTIEILKEVAGALAHAHDQGVVHRDIKPDNVLLSGSNAMVTDFGVAKAIVVAGGTATSAFLTSIGVVVGTPAYMAPEQAAADPDADHRADIYAFGAMAYELLAGEPPFEGRTPQSLMAAHISERPVHLARKRGDVPPRLAELVMQCLAKKPAERPQHARELLVRLGASSIRKRTIADAVFTRPVIAAASVVAIIGAGVYMTRPAPTFETAPTPLVIPPGGTPARVAFGESLFKALRIEDARSVLAPIIQPTYLMPVSAEERITAYKYLGAIHAIQDRPDSATTYLMAAMDFDPFLELDPRHFGNKEQAAFAEARRTMQLVRFAPIERGSATVSGPDAGIRFRIVTSHPSRLTVDVIRRGDSTIRARVVDGVTSDGVRRISWPMTIGDSRAEAGVYEIRGTAVSTRTSNTVRDSKFFRLQFVTSPSGQTLAQITPATDQDRDTPPESADAVDPRTEVQLAVSLYETFNVEQARPIFQRVITREDRVTRADMATAYKFLGATYAVLAMQDTAVRYFEHAIRRDPDIDLDPSRFASAEIDALRIARTRNMLVSIAPVEPMTSGSGERRRYFRIGVNRPARLILVLRRPGTSVPDATLFDADTNGVLDVMWDGKVGNAAVGQGRHELVLSGNSLNSRFDTTRALIAVRHLSSLRGGRVSMLVSGSP